MPAASSSSFPDRGGELCAEGVTLGEIAARHGTPCYVYSKAALEAGLRAYTDALAGRDALVCYALKANSSLAIVNLFARGGAGFDIVSAGELERVIAARGDPSKVVFSGVGKSAAEMQRALTVGILCFNVESEAELRRLEQVAAAAKVKARVSFRVNPDVDARTHPYISTGLLENKFGVPLAAARPLYHYARASKHLDVIGIGVHIGSQIVDTAPFLESLDKVIEFIDQLASEGVTIRHLDFGGGLGIRYKDENPPHPADYLAALLRRVGERPWKLLVEPGRSIVGNAGILLTRVEYLKETALKAFAIVDAAMNDLMRPALYDAWHEIRPVVARAEAARRFEVVGPVCESGDFLAHDRALAIREGDLLAVMSAGAYGMSMSSNYNSRPRAAEVLVEGTAVHLIRERETLSDLYRNEFLVE
jgi:diaminopimelate decarboxylase